MISALPMIPIAANASRVVRGMRVEHVCGDPSLSAESDLSLTRRIVRTALKAMQTEVTAPTMFEPSEEELREAVHAS